MDKIHRNGIIQSAGVNNIRGNHITQDATPHTLHLTLYGKVLCNAVSLQFSSAMCRLKKTKPIKRSAQIHKEARTAQLFIQNKHTTITKQEQRV